MRRRLGVLLTYGLFQNTERVLIRRNIVIQQLGQDLAIRMRRWVILNPVGILSKLLETSLITVEPSSYYDKSGMKWKGNNLYTILPIHSAMDISHQHQLRGLELDVARSHLAAQTTV